MASKNPFLSGRTPAKPQGVPAKRPGHNRSSSSSADLLFARPEDASSPVGPGGGAPGLSLSDWISMADTLRTQVEQVSAQPTGSQRSSIVSLDSDAELDSFRGSQSDESSEPAPALASPTPPLVDRGSKPTALTLRKGHGRSRSMGDPLATIALSLPRQPQLPGLDEQSAAATRKQFSKAHSATVSATFPISEETSRATAATAAAAAAPSAAAAAAASAPPATTAAPATIDIQAEVDGLVARNAALKQVNSQMQHELSRVKADRLFLEQKLSLVITAARQ